MSADTDTIRSAAADAAAAPLDLLLTNAAVGTLRRMNPGGSGLRLAAALATRPRLVVGRGRHLAAELARVTAGTSQVQPSRRDRRFADPGWAGNPLLRRAMQAYLAAAQTAEGVVADAGLDGADAERVGFVLTNLIDALAPSNNPLLNPAALKAALDTGGGSAVAGLRHFLTDMAAPPRVPSMVEPDAFEVGGDLAVTPGSVVLRTPVFELIQCRPATAAVRQVPLLVVPPTINKFYVMDLAPGRSLAEYLVASGLQVFMISWRNPDARHAKWDFGTYGQAVLDAMDAVARISGSEQTALMGTCSGGIIAAMVAAHLASTGQQDRIAAFTLMVTVLDQEEAGLASAVVDERSARLAAAASRTRGYLDGRSLAEVFAWLRPNDLIWNYWVNNYLLGRKPPPFDILFWNADTTRMAAGLHRDFLRMGATNALVRPGGVTMLGSPVDLGLIDRDTYLVAGITDHICPWPSCYRSTQLLGGRSRFVLSTSGHVAAMVNPPGNEKARYQVAKECPADPQEWLRHAETTHGSWWPDYVKAAGISPTDLALRAGYLKAIPLPPNAVLGFEAPGTVDAVGPGVTGTSVGDDVTALLFSLGGYAEYAVASTWTRKPDTVSWIDAATLPSSAEAAVGVLRQLDVTSGETLLLFGGGGSVGIIATQLAVARGVTVISAVGEHDETLARELGATPVRYGAGLAGRVRALGAVDAVFDAAGKGVLADAIALAGGPKRVITLSDPAAADFGVTLSEPTADRAPGALDQTIALLADGRLRLRAHQSMPMQHAADAHRQLESGPVHQRIILTLN